MKKLLVLLSLLPILIVTCKPSVKEAIAYNDTLVHYHAEIDKYVELMADTYENYIAAEMDSAYKAALQSTEKGIEFVQSLGPFSSDDTYRQSVLDLFMLYKSVIETEHTRMIELMKLPPEKYQQKEIEEFERLSNESKKKILDKIEEINRLQVEFAKKFNFEIDTEEKEE
jgi:hypothetical protein